VDPRRLFLPDAGVAGIRDRVQGADVVALRVVGGRAGRHLATAIAGCLDVAPASCSVSRFPDGELRPGVGDLRGDDVYAVQPTGPPVNDNLVELLLILDACRRAGAERVTAVVPYYGYARQDRRERAGQAIGARMVADAISAAGAHRVLVVDPHTPALEAMFGIDTEPLTAVPVLVNALAGTLPDGVVVLAPDLGAVKLAERVAGELDLPVAVARKTRLSGTSVRTTGLVGDVTDRPVLIVDDMISTGATIVAAAEAALAHGAAPDLTVAATHALLVADATDRLAALPLHHLVATDTVPLPALRPPQLDVRSVAPLLADALGRLHTGGSRDDPPPHSSSAGAGGPATPTRRPGR
jgi:ribose-phosphate pyrophosphokinase